MQPDVPTDTGVEVARIKALQDNAQRLGLTWQLRPATVVSGPNPATANRVTIVMDGDVGSTPAPIEAVSMIGPLAFGMRVYVIISPPAGNHVVGLVDGQPPVLGKAVGISYALSLGSTTSATPVAMPSAPAVAFRKQYEDTYLHFVFTCTFFSTVADAGPAFSAAVPSRGIDIQVGRLDVANGAFNTRQQCAGQAAALVPAGEYTFEGYWRRSTGTGTLFVAADDVWTMSIEEYLPQ
ncbi:MAG TPA: hypothetical protein VFG35_19820 [Actinoplanes sp.]|nr:hypothetical protein [Actinoplanes sp.]